MTNAEFEAARPRLQMVARMLIDDRETLRAAVVRLSVALNLDPTARALRHEYVVCLELLTAATQLHAAELAFDASWFPPTDASAQPLPTPGDSPT